MTENNTKDAIMPEPKPRFTLASTPSWEVTQDPGLLFISFPMSIKVRHTFNFTPISGR